METGDTILTQAKRELEEFLRDVTTVVRHSCGLNAAGVGSIAHSSESRPPVFNAPSPLARTSSTLSRRSVARQHNVTKHLDAEVVPPPLTVEQQLRQLQASNLSLLCKVCRLENKLNQYDETRHKPRVLTGRWEINSDGQFPPHVVDENVKQLNVLVERCLHEASAFAAGRPFPLSEEDDNANRPSVSTRQATVASMERLCDFVFEPFWGNRTTNLLSSRRSGEGRNSTAATTASKRHVAAQTSGRLGPRGPLASREAESSLYVPSTVGAPTANLQQSLHRNGWTRDIVRCGMMGPASAAGTNSTRAMLEREGFIDTLCPSVVSLHSILERFDRSPTTQDGDGVGGSSMIPSVACLALLRRFLKTQRFPCDFRPGVSAEMSRFSHDEDALIAAFPCVLLPHAEEQRTVAVRPPDGVREEAYWDLLQHAWLLVCRRSVFVLTDATDPIDMLDPILESGPLSRDDAENRKKHRKQSTKRNEQREKENNQLKDNCELLCIAQFASRGLIVEAGQASKAFQNRSIVKERNNQQLSLPPPPIDVLMELYGPTRRRIDPQEMVLQASRSMVLTALKVNAKERSRLPSAPALGERAKFSIVFCDGVSMQEAMNLFWVALSPRRQDAFAFPREFRGAAGDVGDLDDSGMPTGAAPSPLEFLRNAFSSTSAARKSDKNSSNAVAAEFIDLTISTTSKKELLERPCDLVNEFAALSTIAKHYVESPTPWVQCTVSSGPTNTVEWYPMHLLLHSDELELCTKINLHPRVLYDAKRELLERPERCWFSLVDVAGLLAMPFVPQLSLWQSECVADFYVRRQLCEEVDVIERFV